MTQEPSSVPQPQPRPSDQQMWQVLSHASAFIQLIGIPSLIGPLIVWFMKRDDPAVEPHARAALNFQLTRSSISWSAGFWRSCSP